MWLDTGQTDNRCGVVLPGDDRVQSGHDIAVGSYGECYVSDVAAATTSFGSN